MLEGNQVVEAIVPLAIASTMSTASKVTLALTTLGAIGIVISVHYGQKTERAVCLS